MAVPDALAALDLFSDVRCDAVVWADSYSSGVDNFLLISGPDFLYGGARLWLEAV